MNPIPFILIAATFAASFAQAIPKTEDVFTVSRMDGVKIEAVETYIGVKQHQVGFGAGIYPFNAFYNGFSLSGDYTYTFSNELGWEVLQGAYTFTVDKDLAVQLAERNVSAQTIERLEFLLTSNLVYSPAYGKFVLGRNTIHYFRASALGGLGYVRTTQASSFALSLGARFETLMNEKFSLRLDVRDAITLTNGTTNYITFFLSTGLYF